MNRIIKENITRLEKDKESLIKYAEDLELKLALSIEEFEYLKKALWQKGVGQGFIDRIDNTLEKIKQ